MPDYTDIEQKSKNGGKTGRRETGIKGAQQASSNGQGQESKERIAGETGGRYVRT